MADTGIEVEPGSIAIVGIAGHFPAARSTSELWRLLRDSREATQWPSEDELRAAGVTDSDLADPNYVRATLVLPDLEMFDAEFFGFSRRDAAVLDPQHRHFLECAWEALEDAGHVPEHFEGSIGVFGGCGMQAYFTYNLLTNPQLVKSMGLFLLRHTGNDKDFLCSRVSYLLNLKGPSVSVQTACSTSLVAVHLAAQSLLSGECDMALAGGASIELPHRQGYRFAEGEILSPDGHCRAFDDAAAGTIFGSGAALVVLRRLEDALRDGDNIYAVIRGSAVNNDGSQKAGYLAPSVDGQASAAAEALAVAGVEPGSVQYIECHGTGTAVGDPIEVAALTQAYGAGGKGFCGIGSIKTNIGHLDTAAGTASLIKVALALRHGLIPASLNFTRPNSRIEMADTPFAVVSQARPWPPGDQPRRAAVNSLGVGGTNAHAIIEEAPLAAGSESQPGIPQVFTLSARSPASLEKLKAKWVEFLAEPPPDFTPADAAYTLQVGRRAFEHRLAIVATAAPQLGAALQARNHPHCVASKAGSNEPAVVFMFPGGGAHYPGAGRELLTQAAFRQAVDECFALMPADAPADLRATMFERDAQDGEAQRSLQRPRYAIPALFVLEYAIARLWTSWGVRPAAVIGHSAGEYAAACLAGAMTLADALAIVVLRGQIFEAAPPGAMLSVDLGEAELGALVHGLDLDIAAVNAPDLCIASGSLASIAALENALAERGLEGRRLHIDVAAHSRLLDGVLERFRQRVAQMQFAAPSIPFISNVTGDWADESLIRNPDYWVRHLRQPVQFAHGLAHLRELPDAVLIEVGPGQGLCALARQNQLGAQRMVLASTCKAQEPNADLALMMTSAGALWTRGGAPDWAGLREGAPRRRVSLPTYAFERQRHWVDPGARAVASADAASPTETRKPVIERLPSVDDWLRVPQWTTAPPAQAASVMGEQWLVFGNGSQLTADVLAKVQGAGASVVLVRAGREFSRTVDGHCTIAPGDAQHFVRLLSELESAGFAPERIVHLWALDTRAGELRTSARELAFDSLVHLAQAIQNLDVDRPIHLTIVTASSFGVAGESMLHPERALALGPCRVIPRELPNVGTRLVDLPASELSPDEAARAVVLEAAAGAEGANLVAWRKGTRWIQQLARIGEGPAPARLREGGVYLITGGLGDIALELATYLAQTQRARLALVSRRALPPRPSWRALAADGDHSAEASLMRRLVALEDQGAQVAVFSADAGDHEAMARVIGQCRERFGAIHGAFHAAGVLDDAPIAAKTPESIQRVLTKAQGAQVLHELLPPGTLDVFAVFSSTSVLLGTAGQVDYVAANAFLDSLAASRPDGFTIRWGIWGDRGMAARTYGPKQLAHSLHAGAHPLLGTQVDGDNGAAFEATFDSRALWVLAEHRVGGRCVLPGTAYIEIARAAMMALHPGTSIEIRSLSYEEAMVFEPGATREVRTELRRSGAGYEFTVRSRAVADQVWVEHAHGGTSVLLEGLASQATPPAGGWQPGTIPQEQVVAFGERWHNIVRMQLGIGQARARIELPQRFHADLGSYGAHPALVDMAATFGLHLLDPARRAGQLFVPLSVDRIRLGAPLPAELVSQVRLREGADARLASFDVALGTADGRTLATMEGFSMRGVPAGAMPQQPAREPTLAESMLAAGIRGGDAHALFDRIFRCPARELVVSSIDLAQLERAMKAAAPKAAARTARTDSPGTESGLNPVEAVLADVWRELLGVEDIAAADDFFALGGHSLAAVRLFARIRKHYGVDLPLATLFQAPTLGALAQLVAQHAGVSLEKPAADEAPKKSNVISIGTRGWSPLVTICRGSAGRVPLFCVHGAGGNVLNFKVISDRLGPEQPFYGLQAQGVDGRLPPLGSIEDMAAQYLQALRAVRPHGPYQLAGYSAGGAIALEMAAQLKRENEQVALLAMIDTLSPLAAARKVTLLDKLRLLRHFSLEYALQWPQRRRQARLDEANYALALQRLARGEPLTPELVEFHLFYNFIEAQSRYSPPPYEGDLVLFKASRSNSLYLTAGPALGWDRHVRGQIRVTRITGTHLTIMSEPGVTQLIEGLRVELGLSERREEGSQTTVIGTLAAAAPATQRP